MTVEELRTAVKTIISVPSLICGDSIDTESMALVDSLISAAEKRERERIKQILIHDLGIYLAFPSDKSKFDGVKVDKVWTEEVDHQTKRFASRFGR